MKYGIVVDSGCDLLGLPNQAAEHIQFTRVALKLNIGEKVFVDDIDLDIADFMQELEAYPGKTGSAAPSPQDWLTAFEKSDMVFAISITGTLSASYSSAQIAARMFRERYPQRQLHLIDSLSTGPEISLIVGKLSELMQQNLPFESIVQRIEAYRKHTHLLFILQSLDNLVKNGRVSKIQGSLASILGIKILGTASEKGELQLLHKHRGKLGAYNRAIEEMVKRKFNGGKVIIAHCFNAEMAEYIKDKIRQSFSACQIQIMKTSGLCSYYAERGGILIGFEA